MADFHLVRVGALANVGRFAATDAVRYPRGARVIVRTDRGLEMGEVVAPALDEGPRIQGDGVILRGATVEDRLLEARLRQRREAAFEACSRLLAERGVPGVPIDVEHLFDGQTLVFYFLGDPPAAMADLATELAETYDAHVQFRAFAEAVAQGCGPACGTPDAAGCQDCTTGCAVAAGGGPQDCTTGCAVAAACGKLPKGVA